MAGPSKCTRSDDGEIHKEIWKEEFIANSGSEFSDDSDMVEKFLSGSKQSNHSDDEDNVNVGSDMDKSRG
jgi:hypothetical protein